MRTICSDEWHETCELQTGRSDGDKYDERDGTLEGTRGSEHFLGWTRTLSSQRSFKRDWLDWESLTREENKRSDPWSETMTIQN